MILSPNEIPNCVAWLDTSDLSTMFQDVSVSPAAGRTNFWTYSENLGTWTNVSWANARSFDVAATAAPNGTFTADKFGEENGGGNFSRGLQRTSVPLSSGTWTFSAFVKAAERTFCYLGDNNGGVYVNLTTGASLSSGVVYPCSAVPVGNGWYRAWFTTTITPATSGVRTYFIYSASSLTSTITPQAAAGTGFYVWGVQLENSSTLGSYITATGVLPGLENREPAYKYYLPVNPVTRGGQSVAYIRNKSLSADFYGLSAFMAEIPNSSQRPVLSSNLTWSGTMSTLRFDNSDDCLTGFTLNNIVTATEQTIFVLGSHVTNTNVVGRYHTIFSQTSAGLADIATPPLSTQNGQGNVVPLVYNWAMMNPVNIYFRSPTTFVAGSAFSYHNNLYDTMNWKFTPGIDSLGNPFVITHERANRVIRNSINSVKSPSTWSHVLGTSNFAGTNPSRNILTGVNVFRVGAGINSDFSVNQANGVYTIGEVIMYDRALSDLETLDVEYYLTRKWHTARSTRSVYALTSGYLNDSTIYSISGEPAPWNVLLSTDTVFTNSFILTASKNQAQRLITNQVSPSGGTGGYILLSAGVTLSAEIMGGVGPYTLTVAPYTTSYLVGNIFGGGWDIRDRSSNGIGVGLFENSMLMLTGNITGGFSNPSNGCGVLISGANIDVVGTIRGGNFRHYDNGGYPTGNYLNGSLHCPGISAINCNLYFDQRALIFGGGLGRGIDMFGGSLVLKNTRVSGGDNVSWIDRRNLGQSFNGVYCWSTLVSAVSTSFNAELFSGVRGQGHQTATPWRQITDYTNGSGMYAVSSNIFLQDCSIRGSLHNGQTMSAGIQMTFGTSLTSYNTPVDSGGTIVGGNLNWDRNWFAGFDNWCQPGVAIDHPSCTAYMYGTNVNSRNFGGVGILSCGTLYLTGSVLGGGTGNVGPGYWPGIANFGRCYAEGAFYANPNGYAAVVNYDRWGEQYFGVCQIKGYISPASYVSNTIISNSLTPQLSVFYTDPFISSVRGVVPVNARSCLFFPLCSSSLYTRFATNGLEDIVDFRDAKTTLDYPASSDVLLGVTYGVPPNTYTGTVIIPPASATIIGVPVRSIFGTARPLTVDQLWNQPINNVNAGSNTIFSKLVNPNVTSVILSAIVDSLDYPQQYIN